MKKEYLALFVLLLSCEEFLAWCLAYMSNWVSCIISYIWLLIVTLCTLAYGLTYAYGWTYKSQAQHLKFILIFKVGVAAAHLFVSHCVIPPEESSCDEISNDNIYSVMLMSYQDTDYSSNTHTPANQVIPPKVTRWICQKKSYKTWAMIFYSGDYSSKLQLYSRVLPGDWRRTNGAAIFNTGKRQTK